MPVSPETNLDPGIGAPPRPRAEPLPKRRVPEATTDVDAPSEGYTPPPPEPPRNPGPSERLGSKAVGAVVTGPTALGSAVAARFRGPRASVEVDRADIAAAAVTEPAAADDGATEQRLSRSAADMVAESGADDSTPAVLDDDADADDGPESLGPVQFLALIAVIALIYVGATAWQVWEDSQRDEVADGGVTADAIVVLGAAQYDGEPSPVLEGRLQKALDLYLAGAAPIVVTTGANQEGDRFTEGFAGYDWLKERGVAEDDILIDVSGTNTYEQLTSTSAILTERDMATAILVSDPYHNYRLGEIADEVGMDAVVSPTDLDSSITNLVRETGAVSAGRLIGFRRLSNLRD